jgi:hypothetical protein
MVEGWWVSFACLGASVCIGVVVLLILRDRRNRFAQREERKRRFLEETRRMTDDPELREDIDRMRREEE